MIDHGPMIALVDVMDRLGGMGEQMLIRRGELGDAAFSHCMRYRYLLTREAAGGAGDGVCGWVMLNPSTADPDVDDPTIRRCRRYAAAWGYRYTVIANLWAWRATDPDALRQVYDNGGDPVGEHNDAAIRAVAKVSQRLVVAWGAHGALRYRGRAVLDMIGTGYGTARPHALTVTKDGHPGHPLYLSKSLAPRTFERRPDGSIYPM